MRRHAGAGNLGAMFGNAPAIDGDKCRIDLDAIATQDPEPRG